MLESDAFLKYSHETPHFPNIVLVKFCEKVEDMIGVSEGFCLKRHD